MAKNTITVQVASLTGKPTTHVVNFKKGMTVAQALAAAGISAEGKDLSVQSKPGRRLEPGATVVVAQRKLAAGQGVTVTERPQGS